MKCGICHTPLKVRGHRSVPVSGGRRRVPLYHPCPSLDDASKHPARHRGRPGSAAATATPSPADSPPFHKGARLRFLGVGPFTSRIASGSEVVVKSTYGTRSFFEHGRLAGAIWPEHASHWQVIDSADR